MPEQSTVLTAVERRTLAFYEWEIRGRGWQLYDCSVSLEPPFVPFSRALPSGPQALDDGRQATWLSDLWERVAGRGGPKAENPIEDVVVEPRTARNGGEPVELRLLLGEPAKNSGQVFQAWLRSISTSSGPISFEVIGTRDGVTLQFAVSQEDAGLVRDSLAVFFPEIGVEETSNALGQEWLDASESVVMEFGLAREFMLPLCVPALHPDPLTPLIGALAGVQNGGAAVLQVLFEEVVDPWAVNTTRAVTTARGEPFFADAPELTAEARRKTALPLYAVVLRIGACGSDESENWEIVRRLSGGLAQFGGPQQNEFIPLSAGDARTALEDLLNRGSHRSGMLLNIEELTAIAHPPTEEIHVPRLLKVRRASKARPADLAAGSVQLGTNKHRGQQLPVWLSEPDRLRHMHIVGASGTGKSTLLLELIRQDMEGGRGLCVIDPHGDVIDDVLGLVPAERREDVVLLDPAEEEHVVGWNVLSAETQAARDILSSDLVAVFRRLSTSWGDQMTTVLANALEVFLEPDRTGTLVDVRNFLIDATFRKRTLEGVQDDYLRSYWEAEFPLLIGKKPQAPILTRLNTFLRPRIVRRVVTESIKPIDFADVVDGGRVLLAKLAQGTIGEENASLLGALLVSKIHQTTLARQDTIAAERRPFFLYVDEFHQVATPSMAALFSGMRKYRMGLIVAHQDLQQLRSTSLDLERAVMTNAQTRVCFRVDEKDARELGAGFADFTSEDIGSLELGQAICRVGGRNRSFNLETRQLAQQSPDEVRTNLDEARRVSRERYGRPIQLEVRSTESPGLPVEQPPSVSTTRPETVKPEAPKSAQPKTPMLGLGQGGPEHQYLQELVKQWGQAKGFHVTVEAPVLSGKGRVDIVLRKGDEAIACEIAVTSGVQQETSNVKKCLEAGFERIFVISRRQGLLHELDAALRDGLDPAERSKVQLLSLEEVFTHLEQEVHPEPEASTVAGYSVKVRMHGQESSESRARGRAIAEVITRSVQRLRKSSP